MARKKRPSVKQLAARAKFIAMAKARSLGRRGKRAVKKGVRKLGRKSKAAVKAFRRTNPESHSPKQGQFQIACAKAQTVLYLSGIGLSSNRETASNYGTLSTARKIAKQVRDAGHKLGIRRVAVVTTHDDPRAIRSYLLGGA